MDLTPSCVLAATAADWNQQGYGKYGGNRYNTNQGGVSTVFNFFATDEEDTFSLVDNKPAPRQRFGARRFNQQRFQRRDNGPAVDRDQGVGAVRERSRQQRIQSKKQQQWNTWAYNRNRDTITYNSSVDIRPDWAILEQVGPAGCGEEHVIRRTLNPRLSSETASCDVFLPISARPWEQVQLSALTKLTFPMVDPKGNVKIQPEELGSYGKLRWFDKSYDRVTPKLDKELAKTKRNIYTPTSSDDPVLQELAGRCTARVPNHLSHLCNDDHYRRRAPSFTPRRPYP